MNQLVFHILIRFGKERGLGSTIVFGNRERRSLKVKESESFDDTDLP